MKSKQDMSLGRQAEQEEFDDDYRESEDEDFDPEAPGVEGSDDEDDDVEAKKLDAAYSKFQGSGGLIKTRAQRLAEAQGLVASGARTEKPVPVVGSSSIDVDSLWEEMNSSVSPKTAATTRSMTPSQPVDDEYIVITRTFKFAGEVKTETKTVLRNSAEGQDYLRQKKEEEQQQQQQQQQRQRRTSSDETKQAQQLYDDQNLNQGTCRDSGQGPQKARSENLLEAGREEEAKPKQHDPRSTTKSATLLSTGREPVKRKMSLMEEYQMNKTKKINTLEKSRLDWLGFVDKEGINAELKKHNKAGYLDKQSFLSRVDEKTDREIRQGRAKKL